jgi:P2-related tail formation protein
VVGATFEGDNEAKVAGRTVKRWTTTSTVSVCEPGKVFEFVAEGMTTWRYVLEPAGAGTRVTETFSYEPKGFQGFVYEKVLRRQAGMTKGMQRTLERLKAVLEAS